VAGMGDIGAFLTPAFWKPVTRLLMSAVRNALPIRNVRPGKWNG
jgi:hypothetical protein